MLTPARIAEIEALAAPRRRSTRYPNSFHRYETSFMVGTEKSEGNAEMFLAVMKFMRGLGWKVGKDPRIEEHYRILSRSHRAGEKGDLRFKAEFYPAGMKIEFYPNYGSDNPNGQEYGFRKYERATYLDKKRLDYVLGELKGYFERRGFRDTTEPKFKDPREEVEYRIRSCWHFKEHDVETQNRPDMNEYNRRDQDNVGLTNGMTRYFRGWHGELLRGVVYHHINNMWWVIASGQVHNVCCSDLFSYDPARCAKRYQCRELVSRMRRKLERAIASRDYKLADVLTQKLWRIDGGIGGEEPYVLMKRGLYYRGGYNGYTSDLATAGLYTRENAERHARGCSGEVTFRRLSDLTGAVP